jgi:hypothetical protein
MRLCALCLSRIILSTVAKNQLRPNPETDACHRHGRRDAVAPRMDGEIRRNACTWKGPQRAPLKSCEVFT